MKYLLDTAVFLWMLFDQRAACSRRALRLLEDPAHELFLSAASTWEIAIKYALGKLPLKQPPGSWLPDVIIRMGLSPLPITAAHTWAVAELPWHHRDPFDRLLVAQSRLETLPLISPDRMFRRYRVEVLW